MAKRGARPDELDVEFGLKISTTGSVIVAAGTAEASLVVKVVFKRAQTAMGADGRPE